MERVEWTMRGEVEQFRIIADKTARGWQVAEKSIWGSCWYPVKATSELIAQAEKCLAILKAKQLMNPEDTQSDIR